MRQKAKRLKRQRRAAAAATRRAAARRVAARRAAEVRKRVAARREARVRQLSRTPREGGEPNEAVREAVAVATIAALLILGLALVPAYAVPWYRMSVVLQDNREQFAIVGAMTLLGAAILLSLTFLGQ